VSQNNRRTENQGVPGRFQITQTVLERIQVTIGRRKAEQGGMLGGVRATGAVTHFYFDETGKRSGAAYTPNNAHLTHVLKTQWKPKGIEFLGFVHSHPPTLQHPSGGDAVYAKRILEAMELPYLLTPIVTTIPDTGWFSLFPFAAVLNDTSVDFVEQDLIVEGVRIRPVKKGEQGKPMFDKNMTDADMLVALGLAGVGLTGLVAATIATAQMLDAMRREQ
jgi:hypothetical protein